MALENFQIEQLRSRVLSICADGDMVFSQPWEAKAFAIIVTLSQAGYFTWSEWVDCFSAHVSKATTIEAEGGTAKAYYEQWVDATEELLTTKGITSSEQLFARRFNAIKPSTSHARVK
jgi:nitrile hydratase accessory protein